MYIVESLSAFLMAFGKDTADSPIMIGKDR